MADFRRRLAADELTAVAGGAWSVGAQDLEDIGVALRYEQEGTRIRRQIAAELRKAVEPAMADARSRILAMRSAGLAHQGEPLRTALAGKVKAQVRFSGKATGVRVRVPTTPGVRGFANAPRRTNRRAGWRHPVFGDKDRWVHQAGAVGWFDDAMHAHPEQYVEALQKVIQGAADRIRNGV